MIKPSNIIFSIQSTFADAKTGPAKFEAHLVDGGKLAGNFEQAERFNVPLLFFDSWREAPLVSADRQFAIGAIFSSPLVANGVVYFGSTDGFLYALD